MFSTLLTKRNPLKGLVQQLNQLNIPFLSGSVAENVKEHDLILDGIFGFSFKGEIRPPFDQVIQVRIYCIETK